MFVDRCQLATDICRTVPPPLVDLGNGRTSRCHHIDRLGELVEPAPTAGSLNCRVLVLHGDRDYQVTLDDFALFEKALAGKSTATLKRFENLNHLFMDGKGKATPADYDKVGHVAREVIETISGWMK